MVSGKGRGWSGHQPMAPRYGREGAVLGAIPTNGGANGAGPLSRRVRVSPGSSPCCCSCRRRVSLEGRSGRETRAGGRAVNQSAAEGGRGLHGAARGGGVALGIAEGGEEARPHRPWGSPQPPPPGTALLGLSLPLPQLCKGSASPGTRVGVGLLQTALEGAKPAGLPLLLQGFHCPPQQKRGVEEALAPHPPGSLGSGFWGGLIPTRGSAPCPRVLLGVSRACSSLGGPPASLPGLARAAAGAPVSLRAQRERSLSRCLLLSQTEPRCLLAFSTLSREIF